MSREGHYKLPHQEVIHLQSPLTSALEREVREILLCGLSVPSWLEKCMALLARGFCNVFCIFPISSTRAWGQGTWYAFTPVDTCHLAKVKSWGRKSCRRGGSFCLYWYVNTRFRFWLSCQWLIPGHFSWPMSLTFIVSCLLPDPGAMENTSE